MTTVIAIILFLIFLFLASIHVYWAFGGHWGREAAIPTRNDNAKLFNPGPLPTLIVAAGLLLMGLTVLIKGGLLAFDLPAWIDPYACWIIAFIFILRAIGDFRYVGFFKKLTKTKFAKNDTRYYSPLCLIIAILTALLALYK
jgi:hypothetical protein